MIHITPMLQPHCAFLSLAQKFLFIHSVHFLMKDVKGFAKCYEKKDVV